MCGRIVVDYEQLEAYLRTGGFGETPPELAHWFTDPVSLSERESSWNIAPTQRIPIAYTESDTGRRTHAVAHWSLIPPGAPSLTLKYATFNARSETAAFTPTFRQAVAHERCIIPVTGFYEWTGPRSHRVPHAISGPTAVLTLAGLMSWWRRPGSDAAAAPLATATILTTAAQGNMTALHDRMPIFLSDHDIKAWLDPQTKGDTALLQHYARLARPISEQLTTHAVAPLRGDGAQLLTPVSLQDPPMLW